MDVMSGAGKSEIVLPPGFLPQEGFAKQLDELYVRAVLLKKAENEVMLLSIDMTSLPPEVVELAKNSVSRVTGIAPLNIWICVSHTFSVPHVLPEQALKTEADRTKKQQLLQALEDAVCEAAKLALKNKEPVSLEIGSGVCYANVNRDFETPKGWWIGNQGEGASDKTLTSLSFVDKSQKVKAVLFNYAVQPSVLDGSAMREGGKAVCSDLAGHACRCIEKEYPDAVALFLIGAAGDQAPRLKAKTVAANEHGTLSQTDAQDEGIEMVKVLGEEVAEAAIKAIQAARPYNLNVLDLKTYLVMVPAQRIAKSIHDLHPTHSYRFEPQGEREAGFEVLQIGPAMLVGVKPELGCKTARDIIEASPHKPTLVVTLVNGGAKYMADESAYEKITYEAMNSFFAKGAAETLRESIIAVLQK